MKRAIMIAIFSVILFACGPTKEQIATRTAISLIATMTQEYIDNTPKIGIWRGDYDISFTITNEGIIDLQMTLDLGMGYCMYKSSEGEIIEITKDRTMKYIFGSEGDSNTIMGNFINSTTITGTFSSTFYCIAGSQMLIGAGFGDKIWEAKWIE